MKRGRPSKYKAEYCDQAIEFMADGKSVTALAGYLGVARSTVFKWAEENEQFSDALKTGQAKAALWWENLLCHVATTGEGNASAAIFGVKNRNREDWKPDSQIQAESMEDMTRMAIEVVRATRLD